MGDVCSFDVFGMGLGVWWVCVFLVLGFGLCVGVRVDDGVKLCGEFGEVGCTVNQ